MSKDDELKIEIPSAELIMQVFTDIALMEHAHGPGETCWYEEYIKTLEKDPILSQNAKTCFMLHISQSITGGVSLADFRVQLFTWFFMGMKVGTAMSEAKHLAEILTKEDPRK